MYMKRRMTGCQAARDQADIANGTADALEEIVVELRPRRILRNLNQPGDVRLQDSYEKMRSGTGSSVNLST